MKKYLDSEIYNDMNSKSPLFWKLGVNFPDLLTNLRKKGKYISKI